jgi:iron complex transport system substrate-binding protein
VNALYKIMLVVLFASASALAVGSDESYTLEIFGNANMDDTIDEKDLAYVDGVINGANTATNLSDANYDGKIDDDDLAQINQIISGEEKTLTIIDNVNRVVTLNMPLERIVLARMGCIEEALISIGATDKIVGITTEIKESRPNIAEAGDMMDLPEVGYGKDLDYEKILELDPDVVFIDEYYQKIVTEKLEKLPGEIPVVTMELGVPDTKRVIPGIKALGVLFEKESEAGKVIDWIQKYDNIIRDRTKDLDPEKMPAFYIESADWTTYGSDKWDGKAAAECGGRNIIDGVKLYNQGSWGEYKVDPEWVLQQDIDVIFRRVQAQTALVSEETAKASIAEIINRPGWDEIDAVKNGRVYIYVKEMNFAPSNIIGRCYFAKLLQPELFSDLDPEVIANEYWQTFMGYEYPEMWVYPEPK